jgi:5'-nucleotidase
MWRLSILLIAGPLLFADTHITLLHLSDYHSHALPFYTEEGERGGIARAIGYLRREKSRGALVFSGGDTINKGAPAWSDKFGCAEWPWFNGIVDAMALGNHDVDYGIEEFEQCRDAIEYPILSANTAGFQRYAISNVDGVKIGVFAVAGPDFQKLVKTPGIEFGDSVAAAREVVKHLREEEGVHAVVMIGHQHAEADYALARTVPGIDLIFGTHSHLRRELTKIPGTDTFFISPSQYLSHISRVVMTFHEGKLKSVTGELVTMSPDVAEEIPIARRVRRMRMELESDPEYSDLFVPFALLEKPLSVSELSAMTVETMRKAAKADVALSTISSFRRALPAGEITTELMRGALPYDNEIVVCTMSGAQWSRVIEESKSREGSDSESVIAGATRFGPDATIKVATTDYQAGVAYRDVFDCEIEKTGLRVRSEVIKALSTH